VLFTDMVGSTSLRVRLGEERADQLRKIHDDLLTNRIAANGGQVLKGQGDGLVAAFPAASDALRAAVEMQRAVEAHNQRPDALAEIAIRIGLSVGDVSWKAGDCLGSCRYRPTWWQGTSPCCTPGSTWRAARGMRCGNRRGVLQRAELEHHHGQRAQHDFRAAQGGQRPRRSCHPWRGQIAVSRLVPTPALSSDTGVAGSEPSL